MRPAHPTAVHRTDRLAELVCSNSFRGDKLDNAVGLLKEEMRRLGSLVMRAAEASRVPAGAALAVDRELFAQTVTDSLHTHPLITIVRGEVESIPESTAQHPVILATGPLTSAALSADIARLVGQEHLYFYDAISPIVLAESIDHEKVFRQSRWDRSFRGPATAISPPCHVDDGEATISLPADARRMRRFFDADTRGSATVHDFEKEKFFEGCLPIEVMASRGPDTLRFGPMKPVGLIDPATAVRMPPSLRQDNLAKSLQPCRVSNAADGASRRASRMIQASSRPSSPASASSTGTRKINGPTVLDATWQVRLRPALFFAGQMSGVEGYVESAASGLLAGQNAARLAKGEPMSTPPRTTAIGALAYYVSHADPAHYDPSNITFGIMPLLPAGASPARSKNKLAKKLAIADRALEDLRTWMHERTSQRVSAVSPA
jgi:methylenetetrahydrofolate--tRNA-(uracil-5-)-methyltransferase